MTRPVVLVLGGGGMLGHKLAQVLGGSDDLDVHVTVRSRVPAAFAARAVTYHSGVDLGGGADAVRVVVERLGPDVVINAVGAIKHRDLASRIDETFAVNATLPHLLALLNPNPNARVIQISTDCVYTGSRGGYRESDPPDALDLYGRSKACGEVTYGRHLTLRTSMIGFEIANHLGLLSWFLAQPTRAVLRGYTAAVFSGLPTVTLGRLIRALILEHRRLAGLYHVASEPITKYDLLRRLDRAFGLGHEIVPDDGVRVDRSLDGDRLRAAIGFVPPSWDTLISDLQEDFGAWPYAGVYDRLRASALETARTA